MNKAHFNEKANELISAVRGGNQYRSLGGIQLDMTDRQIRIAAIKELTEFYTDVNGKRPDQTVLERLTDVILYEELTDPHPDKMAREEYPFMSEHQFEERYSKELPDSSYESHGTDGKSYRQPNRRKRTDKENRLINLKARARNKEIAKRYNEFIGTQPVKHLAKMSREEIDAYLNVKYTEYQRRFAKGHDKNSV
jgi:hypothetical protein